MTQLQNHNATTFKTPTARVFCVQGSPDKLALYDRDNDRAWLSMSDPINVREHR